MKEFKFCGEITEYVEIPVYVCETQKEMVKEISEIRDVLTFVDEARENLLDTAVSNEEETSVYIIYKDGSIYFKTLDEEEGKFKRYGIKAAVIETAYEYTVFGDFAINGMGDVTIEESEIEEYGVYAGQYDVKEQEAQEVQETVEQTEVEETAETETEETIKTTAEQETTETGEGISKTETTTGTDDSGFEYTRSQAQEIIMAGTSIAREKYREKHNIHSPMDLKKFSRKQLDDYLSKELDYINKFLNDTLPKEIFNAMKRLNAQGMADIIWK